MITRFEAPPVAISAAIRSLKRWNLVHQDATFNSSAEAGLRKEVAYRDRDFLYMLSRSEEEAIVQAALAYLKELDVISPASGYDLEAFAAFRAEVKKHFTGEWTSITPAMERLIYMLTSVKQPKHLLELGSYWGNTLAWFAGPCISSRKQFNAERIIGIDLDNAMTNLARSNFSKLAHTDTIELIAEDARTALTRIPGPFDFVYIEAKDETIKGLYLILLHQIYDRLPPGAWVIAHDIYDYSAAEDLADYITWVRDPAHFRHSIAIDIDPCGLELSIK